MVEFLCIGGPLDMQMHEFTGVYSFRYWSLQVNTTAGGGAEFSPIPPKAEYQLHTFCSMPLWVAQNYPLEMLPQSILRRLRAAAKTNEPKSPALFDLDSRQLCRLIEFYETTTGFPAGSI